MDDQRKQKILKYFPGLLVFKFLEAESSPLIYRVISYKESTDFFTLTDGKYNYKIRPEELFEYTILNPDAIITFSIVKIGENKDVITCLHPTRKNVRPDKIPEVVCRQSITDIFSDMAYKASIKSTYIPQNFVGMSVSKTTCPSDIKFEAVLVCDKVEKSSKMAYYIGDTLEIILSFVRNVKNYNSVLSNLASTGTRNFELRGENVTGYCTTLRQLLSENKFMNDVQDTFGIKEVPFSIDDEETYFASNDPRFKIVENILEKTLDKIYVMVYSRNINIDDFKTPYFLAKPMNDNQIYIIGYDE